jgi:hypothetical protein
VAARLGIYGYFSTVLATSVVLWLLAGFTMIRRRRGLSVSP